MHENMGLPNPFEDDYGLNLLLDRARKMDPKPVGKMPCTLALLGVLDSTLDFSKLEDVCVSAYHLNGLSDATATGYPRLPSAKHTHCARQTLSSAWATWIWVHMLTPSLHPDELIETQQYDKVNKFGKGLPRSHPINPTACPNGTWHCIVLASSHGSVN